MSRRPDMPCAGCGKLMWRGRGSLAPGQAMCRSCRAARAPTCSTCGARVNSYVIRCVACHLDTVRKVDDMGHPLNSKSGARRVMINGVNKIDPRHTRAWRTLRDRVVREEPTCQLAIPGVCTTVSTQGDHIKPVSTNPELALVRSNVRGTCKECNEARGTLPDAVLARVQEVPGALGIFA